MVSSIQGLDEVLREKLVLNIVRYAVEVADPLTGELL